MAKPYILKNSPADRKKLDKVLKAIQDNAYSDREEAADLLAKVKNEIESLANPETIVEGMPSVDTFIKLIQTAAIALNQMGAANEKLLKFVAVCQKFESNKGSKSADKADGVGSSLFNQLSKLDKATKGQALDDDEEEG
jgi:hypothetical protein